MRLVTACLVLLALLSLATAQSSITVQTKYGPVTGVRSTRADVFKGIPFAAPPVGNLRWADPVPPKPWSSPRPAKEFSAACPQDCYEPPFTCPDWIDEDCLYLNVYSPRVGVSTKLPVMVYIHGGNFKQESATVILYESDDLSNHTDTVVVTINYRVGAMGFLVSEDLDGNYAISDQRLALQWVQDNIANFGGDPSRVTIFGQSAGAGSVATHLISPFSKGLFHRAIMHSNPAAIEWKTRAEGIEQGHLFGKYMNCSNPDGSANLACMRNTTWEQVLEAQLETGRNTPILPQVFKKAYPWSPSIGDQRGVMPDDPMQALVDGKFHKVPIMLGTVKEEGIQFVQELFKSPMPEWEFGLLIPVVFGLNNTAAIKAMYPVPADQKDDTRGVLATITAHYTFNCANRKVARAIASQVPTYVYYFDHALSFPAWGTDFGYCNYRVCHGVDLPILFNTSVLAGYEPNEDEFTLTKRMMTFWGRFAHGTSNSPLSPPDSASPAWPLYTANTNYQTMRLDTPSLSVQTGRLEEFCDEWDKIGYLQF